MSLETFAVRPCGMEALDEPQHRTRVNPYAGYSALGECAFQHDARYPTEGGKVLGAGAAGHYAFLPQEISTGPRPGLGRVAVAGTEATTCVRRLQRSRITPYVAMKPSHAGGAKGVTG